MECFKSLQDSPEHTISTATVGLKLSQKPSLLSSGPRLVFLRSKRGTPAHAQSLLPSSLHVIHFHFLLPTAWDLLESLMPDLFSHLNNKMQNHDLCVALTGSVHFHERVLALAKGVCYSLPLGAVKR